MGIEIQQILNVVSPLTAPFIAKYINSIENFYADDKVVLESKKEVKVTKTDTKEVIIPTEPLTTKQKILKVLYYVVNILIGIWAFSISWNVNTHLNYMLIFKLLCAILAYLLAPFYLLFHFMFRYEIIKSYNSTHSANAISGETPFSLLTRKITSSVSGASDYGSNVGNLIRQKMPNTYISEDSTMR